MPAFDDDADLVTEAHLIGDNARRHGDDEKARCWDHWR